MTTLLQDHSSGGSLSAANDDDCGEPLVAICFDTYIGTDAFRRSWDIEKYQDYFDRLFDVAVKHNIQNLPEDLHNFVSANFGEQLHRKDSFYMFPDPRTKAGIEKMCDEYFAWAKAIEKLI